MCIMIITFKIDSAVQNPKDKILQILEEFISQANQDVDFQKDRKSTRLNSSHSAKSRMPSSA